MLTTSMCKEGADDWGADSRAKAIEATIGMYQKFFVPTTETDPANVLWITQLQNLLSQSYTEQSAYDFKQGFFSLSDKPEFDEESFEKVLKTLVGIANLGRDRLGYVIVGIAETQATANRIQTLFHVDPKAFETFWITGVDHEAKSANKTSDQMFQMIVDRVRSSVISEPLKSYIVSNIKPVRYYDKTVYVFEAKGAAEPSFYGSDYYVRSGAQLEKLEPTNLSQLFKRYLM